MHDLVSWSPYPVLSIINWSYWLCYILQRFTLGIFESESEDVDDVSLGLDEDSWGEPQNQDKEAADRRRGCKQ
eukprot:15349674-Ditylum_brightwellii.AAC.1